jgi:hypothetical protein
MERFWRSLSRVILVLGAWIGIVALAGSVQASPIVYALVFSFPLVAFTCVFIHEAGHAVAGLATGGRITSFLVVPVEIGFRPTSFRLRGKAESRIRN